MGLNLIGKIELDGAGFERGLHRAGEKVSEFSTDFIKHAAIAAFGFYGVEEAIHKTVEAASDLVNEAERMDVTIEQLQVLKQAAKDGGVEIESIATAFEHLDEARAKALAGDKEAMAAFTKLGVTTAQLQNQRAATIFTTTLSATVKNGDVQDIGPALKEIMGKAAGELVPVLKSDFNDLSETLKKFGIQMDAETAVSLKHMGDEFDLISLIIATVLGPALVQFANWLLQTMVHSPVVESTDFLAKRNLEMSKLSDFIDSSGIKHSAMDRATMANFFRDVVREAMSNKETFEQFKSDRWDTRFAFAHGFEDFKGNSFKEFSEYLNHLSDPLTEATQKAAKASSADMTGLQKMVDDWLKRIKDEAYKLEHPNAPGKNSNDDANNKDKKGIRSIPSDSLVRVGNFLGTNGNTIAQVNQEKLSLMRQHLNQLKDINRAVSGHGTFGTYASNSFFNIGVPMV